MAYSIRCADAGVDCPGSFTTETKEELIKHMELHTREAHPEVDLQPGQIEALASGALIQGPE
jgi:predicted small metal-binding protein